MSVEQIRATSRPAWWFKAAVFTGLFLLVLLLQHLSGAYRSEFGGYPDEPAHYATSVMVRDYLLSGKLAEPMNFANSYYQHYPKVAFGHWPPLLYVVQGLWMMLFSVSRTAVLVELALTTTLAGFLLFLVTERRFGKWVGVLGAVLLVCLPEIQVYSNQEMAESLLLVTSFQAAVFFCRYLERTRWRDSFWFGVFCSLAILTKGNGWALAMIPPIAIFLTGKWGILARPSFWIPLPLVAAFCLPWQLMTMEMAHRGWAGGSEPSLRYTVESLGQFAVILRELLGWSLTALAALGIWLRVVAPFRPRRVTAPFQTTRVQPLDAVMFALIVAIWVFHSVVPAGVESRKMINAIPAMILFAIAGGEKLARTAAKIMRKRAHARFHLRSTYAGVAIIVALLFASQTFAIPKQEHYGFTELSSYIEGRPDLRGGVVLVSSEADGEGLVISELMMQDSRPGHTVLRANKVLSNSDWNGNVSEQFCTTADDVMRILKRDGVRAVVLDTFPARTRYRHHELILEAIRRYPESWNLVSTFGQGKIQLYEFRQS